MTHLISLSEAANRLGLHVTTVRVWIRSGRLPAYRLGRRFTRVDWNEVIETLSAQKRAPKDSDAVTENRTGKGQ